jgi:hypothetical protein
MSLISLKLLHRDEFYRLQVARPTSTADVLASSEISVLWFSFACRCVSCLLVVSDAMELVYDLVSSSVASLALSRSDGARFRISDRASFLALRVAQFVS